MARNKWTKENNPHTNAGQWKKGQASPNPTGRPKKYYDLQELARSYSTEAIKRLAQIMRSPKSALHSIKAAEILLERAWGKSPIAITGEGGEGPVAIEYSVKWLPASEDAEVIDVTPGNALLLAKGESEGE